MRRGSHTRPFGRTVSIRVLKTLAHFGLTTRDLSPDRELAAAGIVAHARHIDQSLDAGRLALVTGPSGSGKSSLLALMARLSADDHRLVILMRPSWRLSSTRRAPIDLLKGDQAMLSLVGLADVRHMCRPSLALSEGQRARLALALALRDAASAPGIATLLIDEFAAALDERTAVNLAHVLRRAVSASATLRAVIVTHRPTLISAFEPAMHIDLAFSGPRQESGQ